MVVAITVIWLVLQVKSESELSEDFIFFDKCSINGVINKISFSTGKVYVVIDTLEFQFFPKYEDMNNNIRFSHTAKVGDSLIKPAFSDTIYLVKPEGRIKYIFFEY